jgi:hypothetical protein
MSGPVPSPETQMGVVIVRSHGASFSFAPPPPPHPSHLPVVGAQRPALLVHHEGRLVSLAVLAAAARPLHQASIPDAATRTQLPPARRLVVMALERSSIFCMVLLYVQA